MTEGEQDAPGPMDEWPYNVLGWTLKQRWEECYRRLLAQNISHEKICRVWPFFLDYSVRHLEIYLENAPTRMDRIIDDWLAGQGPFGVPRAPRTCVIASKDENGVLLDPLRYIKAIPIKGALAALMHTAPCRAVSETSCPAEQPTKHAAAATSLEHAEDSSPGASLYSCCSLESIESCRGGVSSGLSEHECSANSAAPIADNASFISQRVLHDGAFSGIMAAEPPEGPCEHVTGRHPSSWGNYRCLTQLTHRRHAPADFDPI